MKTARILLAVLSLAALGACGNDSITAPASMAPGGARYETAPATGDDATNDDSGGATVTEGETPPPCAGTLVVTTDPSGNVTTTCVTSGDKGGVLGSGG
jgi:hypothetical protein